MDTVGEGDQSTPGGSVAARAKPGRTERGVTSVVEPGRRCLGDRYELHQLIAAGGMGQVWRGLDIALHRPVAVKVLRSEYTGDPTFLARFRAEAQHAASLSHPNIAVVFDYGEEIAQDGTGETLAYLVMELVEGEPLSTLVAREGPLATETTLSLLRQTAFGLGEAHRAGMVHRDVKPGNILVRPDGSVKITDFGIAWSARSVALTRTGQVIGTPQYLSPEQAEGRAATPASDVYALGLIGYECLTGHPTFDGDNAVTIALKQVRQEPEPLPGNLPAGVRGLIRRALLKDPAARLPDGAAFVAAIDDVLAGRPVAEAPAALAVPLAETGEMPRAAGPVRSPAPVRSFEAERARAGRRRTLATVLLPLLALLAGAGIAAALLQALSEGQPSATASAAEQQDVGSIVLDADNYIGRPVDVVAQRLTALGLNVELREEVTADAVPDQVTAVEPVGESLAAGDTVVVTYAVAPPETASSSRGGPGVTAAAVVDDAEPTEAAPVPSSAPSSSPTLPAAEPTETPTVTSSESSATETTPVSEPSTSASESSPTESATESSSSDDDDD
jgi:serine/threonine-protein kinase